MSGLGEVITQLRYDHALSMRRLAERANLSVTYISKLESGADTNCTIGTLTQLARALSVPVSVLIDAAVIEERPALPAFLYDAAGVLTEDDWAALRPTVEWVAALRRLSLSPEPS